MATRTPKTKGLGKPEPTDDFDEAEFFRDFYASQIEQARPKIESGDGEALLGAMLDVCLSKAPMPDWLTFHVAEAIRRYTHLKVKTLDEAFRVPKRVQFEAKSKRRRHGLMIYFEICQLHSAGVPITQELYHAIGELHGVGRNIVQECYSEEKKRRGRRLFNDARAPEALPKHLWPIYESVTGFRIENRL